VGQNWDVFGPLPLRRQRDREGVEPVEQVLAELACRERLLEQPVGCGDDADAHFARDDVAHWLALPGLQHAQSRLCISGGISPTSSRKMVPISAFSNSPGLSATAPVKAPRLWPKSSDSSSVGARAVQFTVMSGLSRRFE